MAAVASYVDARAHSGEWLVRIEDVDKPREVAGAADSILSDLEFFGFRWDGPVMYQSERTEAYRAALEKLQAEGAAYPCGCSRKDVEGDVYPGTCAQGLPAGKVARAWRVRGEGDFVVLRADGFFAYQLAVVVDDAAQRITDVVRGADLLDSTPRQNHLQRLLGVPVPRYKHVPVVLAADGQKLSKQTGAAGLDRARAGELLWEALAFLGQRLPEELQRAGLREIWAAGLTGWSAS